MVHHTVKVVLGKIKVAFYRPGFCCIAMLFLSICGVYAEDSLSVISAHAIQNRLLDYIQHLGSSGVVSFKATQTLEEFAPGQKLPTENDGYGRTIEGTLSSKGLFRFEITYTSGAASGTKYIVCFDGKRTFIVNSHGASNYLIIQRGRKPEISYLFYAVAIAEPFAFIFPRLFDPNDKGFYVTLDELTRKTTWDQWFNDDGIKISTAKEDSAFVIQKSLELETGEVLSLEMNLSMSTFLPLSINIKSPSTGFTELRKIKWNRTNFSNIEEVMFPESVIIEQSTKDGSRSVFKTTIDSIELPSLKPNNFWSYDIGQATTIFDGDENLLIPHGVR